MTIAMFGIGEDVVRRGLKRTLPCKLDREELTDIAIARAKKEALRDQLDADLDAEKKKRQQQINEVEAEIKLQGRELHTGEQERVVLCNEVFRKGVDGAGYIHVVRLDTNSEVEKRPANAQEAQRYLPAVETVGGGNPTILDQAKARQKAGSPGFDPLAPVTESKPAAEAKPEGDVVEIGEDGKPVKAKKGGGKKKGAK